METVKSVGKSYLGQKAKPVHIKKNQIPKWEIQNSKKQLENLDRNKLLANESSVRIAYAKYELRDILGPPRPRKIGVVKSVTNLMPSYSLVLVANRLKLMPLFSGRQKTGLFQYSAAQTFGFANKKHRGH